MSTQTHASKNNVPYFSKLNESGQRIYSFDQSFDDIWSQEDEDEDEENAHFSVIKNGSRVCAGLGDDYDTGTVWEIQPNGDCVVNWDSLVCTPSNIADLKSI